jgi:hypothetical protein
VYFGTYQLPSRHREFDALPYEVPCAGPGFFATLRAILRRIFH